MILDLAPAALAVREPQNFSAFSVQTTLSGDRLDEAVIATGLGRLDGGHIWVRPGAVRDAVGPDADAEWESGFARMLEFAAGHGWCDPEGRIRAHIDRSDAARLASERKEPS